jgi:hypothetical protein
LRAETRRRAALYHRPVAAGFDGTGIGERVREVVDGYRIAPPDAAIVERDGVAARMEPEIFRNSPRPR